MNIILIIIIFYVLIHIFNYYYELNLKVHSGFLLFFILLRIVNYYYNINLKINSGLILIFLVIYYFFTKTTCAEGEYLNNNICSKCPEKYYCNNNNKYKCNGNKISKIGSKSINECFCEIGKKLENNSCVSITCESGKYLNGNECVSISCEAGKYLSGNECLNCPSDYFCLNNLKTKCDKDKTSNPNSLSKNDCKCKSGKEINGVCVKEEETKKEEDKKDYFNNEIGNKDFRFKNTTCDGKTMICNNCPKILNSNPKVIKGFISSKHATGVTVYRKCELNLNKNMFYLIGEGHHGLWNYDNGRETVNDNRSSNNFWWCTIGNSNQIPKIWDILLKNLPTNNANILNFSPYNNKNNYDVIKLKPINGKTTIYQTKENKHYDTLSASDFEKIDLEGNYTLFMYRKRSTGTIAIALKSSSDKIKRFSGVRKGNKDIHEFVCPTSKYNYDCDGLLIDMAFQLQFNSPIDISNVSLNNITKQCNNEIYLDKGSEQPQTVNNTLKGFVNPTNTMNSIQLYEPSDSQFK